jgi:dGTPase
MKLDTFRTVETLKSFAYQQLIESPRLKLVQKRGKEIIAKLFDSFVNDGDLLPDDWKSIYAARDDNQWRRRTVCDYIAGMTDRYCVEMYARLTGQDPMTFWKPH